MFGKTSLGSTHTHTTILWPFIRDYPGKPVREAIVFWILWCKGRLADTPTIRLGVTPSGLISDPPSSHPIFYIYSGLGQAPNMLACISS